MSADVEFKMIVCPSCEGRKGDTGLACGKGISEMRFMPCHFCEGAGEVTTYQGIQYRLGTKLRHARMEKNYTVREVAKEYGVTLSKWSNIEHGRAANLVEIDDAYQWLNTLPQRR